MRWKHYAIPAALAIPLFLLGSCEYRTAETGPMHDEPVSIDLGNAERARVRLNMGAGELTLRGGSNRLLQGTFEYNVPAWKPDVTFSSGPDADLTIKQPEGGGHFGHSRNLWDLELNDKVLLDFEFNCGAGKARLEMGDMNLQHVAVHLGAGEISLDLRGTPSHDYDVRVEGGVGKATVYVPDQVGVRADAHGGIGKIVVTGLENRDDHYENKLYGTSKLQVTLRVEGGIGEIHIIG